jgi:hypothetical protein
VKNSVKTMVACVGLTACATGAFAQAGGTIDDGNMRFRISAAPATPTSTTEITMDLLANQPAAGSANPDHGFANWWYFRREGETRESAFNSGGGGATSSFTGNVGSMTQFYSGFRADIQWEVFSTGAGQGFMRSTMTITNQGETPLNISLFNYADLDLNGTFGNDRAVQTGPEGMRVFDGGTYTADFSGIGADAYQVGTYPGIFNLLTDGDVDNLNNSGLPFGGASGADFTAAFQWNISIDAGFSRSVVSTIALVPTPGAAAALGLGGLVALRRRRA